MMMTGDQSNVFVCCIKNGIEFLKIAKFSNVIL